MKRLLLSITIAVLAAGAVAGVGDGAVLASVSNPPAHDTYVRATSPGENFDGKDLSVVASTANCNPTDITYLQWDLSGIGDNQVVISATLTLTATAALGTSSARLSLYKTGDNWTEDALTHNTAPAVGTLIETIVAPPPGSPPSPAVITFNSAALAAYVDGQADGDKVASFALRFSSGCSTVFTGVLFEDAEDSVNGPHLHLKTEVLLPDLAIHKAGPSTTRPGATITYTLTYSNTGDGVAHHVVISDPLPAEVLSAAATFTYTGAAVTPRAGIAFIWDVDDLVAGERGVITITAALSPTLFTVPFTNAFTNTASIAAAEVETDTLDNTTNVTTAIVPYRVYLPIVLR